MRILRAPLLLVVGLVAMSVLQAREEDLRGRTGAPPTVEAGSLPPGVAAAALGGLRTPVLAAVWIEADHLWREQKWWALRSRYELIVRLEPRIPAAWGYIGDLMILNLPARAPDPDQAWAWVREGLLLLDRGIAANPESYLLRLQRFVRIRNTVAASPDLSVRYEAWRGRSVEEEALRLARDLAARYPEDPLELTRPAQVHKAFAFREFHRAHLAWPEDRAAAREGYLRATARWRRAEEEYRRHPEAAGELIRYAAAFAALGEALAAARTEEERRRLVTEKLAPFKDYVEAAILLE